MLWRVSYAIQRLYIGNSDHSLGHEEGMTRGNMGNHVSIRTPGHCMAQGADSIGNVRRHPEELSPWALLELPVSRMKLDER